MTPQNYKLYYGEGWNYYDASQSFYIITKPNAQESDIESKLKIHLKDNNIGGLETMESSLKNNYGIGDKDFDNVAQQPVIAFRKKNQPMPEMPDSFDAYVLLTLYGKIDERSLKILREYVPHPILDFSE